MLKRKSNSKRLIIIIGLVLAMAVLGLTTINTTQVSAGQSLKSQMTQLDEAGMAGATAGSDGESFSGKSPVASMSAMSSIFKMISALVVVVICIYGAIFALKKLMGRKITGRDGSEGILEVLETAHLGPKKMVSVVRIADRSVLIGVTENQISLLSELDEVQTAQITAVPEQGLASHGFGDLLKSATTRIKELSRGKPQTALADK